MPDVPAATSSRSSPANFPAGWAYTTFIAICCIAALYIAKDIFVPIALAILLSFVLAPVVRLLRRLRLGRTPSVVLAVTLAFIIFLGIGAIMTRQISQLAENLPRYETNLREKAQSIREAAGGSRTLERITQMFKELRTEVTRPERAQPAPAPDAPRGLPSATTGLPAPTPIPVEVREPSLQPLETAQEIIAPFVKPLTTTGLVIVFAIFILLYREDLRDRFIRLFGAYDLHRTTEAMNETASRLSRFFLVQLGLNSAFGLFIGIGLWIIGVPNPVLWGVLSGLMRFVPYVGGILAAGFPALLAIAVDPGWSLLIWTLALFAISEPVMGQVVEPWAFGHSTGLSPIAVIIAATFWLWLWGPIGLILATPLTLCVMVIGRHVERMEFFEILLGDRPALTPEKGFYQRMLAADPYEVAEQAERYLKDHPLSAYYDDVALRGLSLAEEDARKGRLDDDRLHKIRDSVAAVLEDLSDYRDEPVDEDPPGALEEPESHGVPESVEAPPPVPVLCAPVYSPLDQAGAMVLADLLRKHGMSPTVLALDSVTDPKLEEIPAQIACLSFFGSGGGLARARFLVRKLRRGRPGLKVVGCFWRGTDQAYPAEALRNAGIDAVVLTFSDAVSTCVDLVEAGKPADARQPQVAAAG